ncbi:MAG: diguanylate cyclase, partial [Nocardioides sp.]|uniref:sensor domain-containing diguanylate cyclase n=1 Tax=Nocardioides sp. TaxID=35761 RepID=UPI0039E2C5FE
HGQGDERGDDPRRQRGVAAPLGPPGAERSGHPSLASRVIAALVALAVVSLAVLAVAGRHGGDEQLQQSSLNRLVAVDELAAGAIDSQLAGLRDVVGTFAQSDAVRRAIADDDADDQATVVAALSSSTSGIFSASVYDAAGTLLALDPAAPGVVGKSFAYRDWYAGANAATGAYVSRAFQLVTPEAPWALAISSRVTDADGATVGYVVGTFVLSDLQDKLRRALIKHGVSAVLVDSRDTVLASPSSAAIGSTSTDRRLTDHAARTGAAGADPQWAARPVDAIDGWLLAEQPRSAGAGAGSGVWTAFLLSLTVVAIALVGLWLRTDARRRRLERAVAEAHAWTATLVTSVPAPVVLCGEDGRIEMANPAFAELVGRDEHELRGQLLTSWVAPSDAPSTASGVVRSTVVRGGGGIRVVESRARVVTDVRGRSLTLHAMADVTPLQEEHDRLRAQGRLDPLTGVGNRVVIYEALAAAVTSRTGVTVLLMVDLDGFKAVNDTLGHAVGDDVLRAVADEMHAGIPANRGVVARIGGDEFVAVVRLEDAHDPTDLAEELRARLRTALEAHPASRTVGIGVSVGVSIVGVDGWDAEELLRAADARMYDDKRAGGPRSHR